MRRPPAQKLRRLFRALTEAGSELFFEDRKLYDITAVAARDKCPQRNSTAGHPQC